MEAKKGENVAAIKVIDDDIHADEEKTSLENKVTLIENSTKDATKRLDVIDVYVDELETESKKSFKDCSMRSWKRWTSKTTHSKVR
ncbi:hypothetical protein GQ457_01G016030 [Hibiscus cannabinus]